MNVLLTDAEKLLKEEIKGKSSYRNFMAIISPMYQHLDQQMNQIVKDDNQGLSLNTFHLMALKNRLNDINFDVRSLKEEVSYNDGIIDFGNVDTYDDYAIEDIFKNTHILVDTLKRLTK